MSIALYHHRGGYYSDAAALSGHRDFYTSPAAHPAFGALVAVQLSRMWELLGSPNRFYAVEFGAGSGLLARDVLNYAKEAQGPFSEALRYVEVDRSPPGDASTSLGSVVSDAVPFKGVVGCLLSNELLDSFPVHLFEVHEGDVLEVYVEMRDGELRETLSEPSTPMLKEHFRRWGLPLNEDYRGEVNLRIGPWMEHVTRALERGFVLTIDYGYAASEPCSGDRTRATLETFYRHTSGESPYRRIGAQDMTAHVDFTALVSEGEHAGLRPVLLSAQAAWLSAMGMPALVADIRERPLSQPVRDANLMAMREIVEPDGLGAFKVLVQEKATGVTEPGQLLPAPAKLTAPLLRPEHAGLMAAKYPHLAFEPPSFPAGGGP